MGRFLKASGVENFLWCCYPESRSLIMSKGSLVCVVQHAWGAVAGAVWHKYIPQALASGKFQAKPDPEVIEGGLEKVQTGIDLLRQGVSAKKVVVEISKE